MVRWTAIALAGFVAALGACSSDSLAPNPEPSTTSTRGASQPGDTSWTGTDTSVAPEPEPDPTSNGPIATFSVTPHGLTLAQGYVGSLVATALDAQGVRVVKPVAWRSSNPAIVLASDTGIVYAKTLGSAMIYASVDGFTDSASVTVVPAPDPAPQPPPLVSEFNLSVIAVGIIGADTSESERLPGATVTLLRVVGIQGDTLAEPVDAGSAVTDARGEAKFSRLPGGSYRIHVTPPANSVYLPSEAGVTAPRNPDIFVYVALPRK